MSVFIPNKNQDYLKKINSAEELISNWEKEQEVIWQQISYDFSCNFHGIDITTEIEAVIQEEFQRYDMV